MKLLTLLALALLVAGCSGSATLVNSPESSPTATTLGAEATAVKAAPTQAAEPLAATSAAIPSGPAPQDPATPTPVVDPLRFRLDGPTETFSLPGEQRALPDDILQEIAFYAIGGSGDFVCDFHDQLTVMEPEEQPAEWMTIVDLNICGFSKNESVTAEIIAPNGETIVKESLTAYYSTIDYYYLPELNAPAGIYTARFSGNSGIIEHTFEVIVPPGPRVYRQDERLLLFGFEPHETVRLYAFEREPLSDSPLAEIGAGYDLFSLAAWNEFVTDAAGQLIIEGVLASRFALVGETSGEVEAIGTKAALKSIKSPFPVSVLRPTEARLAEAIDIWTLTPFTEFEQPGTQTSEIIVNPEDMVHWSMRWCSHGLAIGGVGYTDFWLAGALHSISMAFTIDGMGVDTPYLRTSDEMDDANEWACLRWATLVTNWPTDRPTTLEIEYELSDTVDGGSRMYAPGTYRHVITVYAGEGEDLSTDSSGVVPTVDNPSLCSGALSTRLAIGDVARVVADRASVREGPGTDYATVYGTSIGSGRMVTILGGPVCSDGMLWWEGETGMITLTNGEQHNIAGWMAEESGGEWLLEPVR